MFASNGATTAASTPEASSSSTAVSAASCSKTPANSPTALHIQAQPAVGGDMMVWERTPSSLSGSQTSQASEASAGSGATDSSTPATAPVPGTVVNKPGGDGERPRMVHGHAKRMLFPFNDGKNGGNVDGGDGASSLTVKEVSSPLRTQDLQMFTKAFGSSGPAPGRRRHVRSNSAPSIAPKGRRLLSGNIGGTKKTAHESKRERKIKIDQFWQLSKTFQRSIADRSSDLSDDVVASQGSSCLTDVSFSISPDGRHPSPTVMAGQASKTSSADRSPATGAPPGFGFHPTHLIAPEQAPPLPSFTAGNASVAPTLNINVGNQMTPRPPRRHGQANACAGPRPAPISIKELRQQRTRGSNSGFDIAADAAAQTTVGTGSKRQRSSPPAIASPASVIGATKSPANPFLHSVSRRRRRLLIADADMQQDDTTTDSDDAENNAMVMAIVPLWDAPPNAMPKGARPTVGGLRMPRPSRRQSSVTFSSTTTTHTTTTRTVTHSKHSPRRPAFNGVGRSGVVGVDAPLNASQIGGANERLYDDVAKVTSVRKSVSQVWVERNEVGYVEAREEGKWDGMDDGV